MNIGSQKCNDISLHLQRIYAIKTQAIIKKSFRVCPTRNFSLYLGQLRPDKRLNRYRGDPQLDKMLRNEPNVILALPKDVRQRFKLFHMLFLFRPGRGFPRKERILSCRIGRAFQDRTAGGLRRTKGIPHAVISNLLPRDKSCTCRVNAFTSRR